MKRLIIFALIFILLVPLGFWQATSSASASGKIPTFSIVSVERDETVTIKTRNFPANDTFKVLMGPMGTRGINGIQVDTIKSGEGGSFNKTFSIPTKLQGSFQIAIRLQSTTGSGYFAYNWFYNNTTGTGNGTKPTATPNGYTGFPTFSISSVVRDSTVTVKTNNLPPNDSFNVLMDVRGNRAINGIKVDNIDSGTGGTKTFTFDIPASLKGTPQIAIRLQSSTGSGYFAFNWFYNNTATVGN